MNLLAIDPGTHCSGYALFYNKLLVQAGSFTANPRDDRVVRSLYLTSLIQSLACEEVVSEEPVTKGYASLALNRLLGMFEYIFPNIHYIKPTAVKKAMGKGTLDKPQVRDAVLKILSDDEIKLLTNLEDFDMIDAVAVGLTYLGRTAHVGSGSN